MAEGEQSSESGGSESGSEGHGELEVTSSLLPSRWMASFSERPRRNVIAFLSQQTHETAVTRETHTLGSPTWLWRERHGTYLEGEHGTTWMGAYLGEGTHCWTEDRACSHSDSNPH